jgi:hypothetical protein
MNYFFKSLIKSELLHNYSCANKKGYKAKFLIDFHVLLRFRFEKNKNTLHLLHFCFTNEF